MSSRTQAIVAAITSYQDDLDPSATPERIRELAEHIEKHLAPMREPEVDVATLRFSLMSAISGLAWAVGCLEAMNQDSGHAGQTLERLFKPRSQFVSQEGA